MKCILLILLPTILLFLGLSSSFGCCTSDDRTLTEMVFQGKPGTIFTCEVLTFSTPIYPVNTKVLHSDGSIDGTATVEIIAVYFGKVDTNIVTLRAGNYLTIGMTYLIYTAGTGPIFSFGGICDRWSKQVTDSPEIINELSILKQFSDIIKDKSSGQFTFTSSENAVIAKGQFKKGKAINIWQHFYDNGIKKAEFDLRKNITSQYSANGFIESRSTVSDNISYYEQFSDKVNGQITYTDREVENDKGLVMTASEYFSNGNIKNLSSELSIDDDDCGSYSGKTGAYKEYYENGKLRLQGQYNTNKRIGLWKWYHENGEFNTQFDYKDGTGRQ